MDEERKKLRICLIFVVTAAIFVGTIYYFSSLRVENEMNDGTLVLLDMGDNND